MHFPSVSNNNNNKTILCIHGSYSDARIFNYVAAQLSENGFEVYSMDLLGHGKSDGKRGDMNFNDCLSSINEVIRKILHNSKVYVLAHSIGCTFALWYAHNNKRSIDGLILMAPYIRIRTIKKRSSAEPNFFYFLYLLLRRLMTPKTLVKMTNVFPQLNEIGGKEISYMLQDKDLNFYYSYRYIVDIIALRNSKVNVLTDIDSVPTLLLHGKNDLIFFSAVSEAFFKLLKNKYKEIELFDCDHWFYDAISYNYMQSKYSEASRKKVIRTIIEWINSIKS
ncbi:MAG TPA: alpha/beta fold hydrolase [Nitrososphaeraceae archaeon]|nr:alpha/beta fold hydrolase [Nitrososphaeraceae archaeon]